MKKRSHILIIFVFILFTLLVNGLLLIINYNISELYNGEINNVENPPINSQLENIGGYSKEKTAYFDILENANSIIKKRDFQANVNNYFNISTPYNWTINSKKFDLESYHKNQTIEDGAFNLPSSISPWNRVKNSYYGKGWIRQSFEPNDNNPENVLTEITYYPEEEEEETGFYAWEEYAFWNQWLNDLNPENLEIQKGDLFQENDNTLMGTNFSSDPDFNKDIDTPYGGVYKENDDIDMDWTEGYLFIDIVPKLGDLGGNPSAAWWSYIEIPYQVDYAQVKISWAIDPVSTFEAFDDYQVSARINNRYIDGRNWIEKDDSIPLNGSKNALMVYNDSSYLDHDYITRTYDVTDLINGTIGINKFDFGVWAVNPNRFEKDRIRAKFDSIEIMYNVSNKYEIAQLDFDYLLVDNVNGGNGVIIDDPNAIVNDLSIYLLLNNGTSQNFIKIIPFNNITKDYKNSPFRHMTYSISQEYLGLLRSNNLDFFLGVIFEKDIYEDMNYELFFDNVSLTINYKHPNTKYSGLQINMDDSFPYWQDVKNSTIYINTTNWNPGDNHTFRFKTINSSFTNKLFLNLRSRLEINLTRYDMDGAFANYEIQSENYEYGIWNVKYNNSHSYSQLDRLNSTCKFNLSHYEINYVNLPAFDEQGSESENWKIYSAFSPTLINFTKNLVRFNYTNNFFNQSAKIINPFDSGNWTIRAYQLNYIDELKFNNSNYYLGEPLILRNSTFQYNFSFIYDEYSDYTGYYNITLLNSSGTIMASYPKTYNTTVDDSFVTGEIYIPASYSLERYYFSVRWNDMNNVSGIITRFGSNIASFILINATYAGFNKDNLTVQPGEVANFSLFYRVKYTDWGINTTNVVALENSTGTFMRWGRAWSGESQFSSEYFGGGNYSVLLDTIGAPNNNYTIKFVLYKLYNQPQNITSNLQVVTTNFIYVEVTYGASYIIEDHYHINDNNIPYVNDSVNSIIQLNLTKNDNSPIIDAKITGKIGEFGYYTEAKEIYDKIPLNENLGIYNLTLDTTGLNATNENQTLLVRCSATGFIVKEITVNLTIKKIPTEINLEKIDSTYEENEISIHANMNNLVNPENPKPNNIATLTYFISKNETVYKTGNLDYIFNGVYTKDVLLSGLVSGDYHIYVNGTAFNCLNSMSNVVNFSILPQESTQIEIFMPEIIRILNPFDIKATLSYGNGTLISNQLVYLNITRNDEVFVQQDSLIISDETDANGNIFYNDYIIPEDYQEGSLIVNATYLGSGKRQASSSGISSKISGKIPIVLTIIDHPNGTARVGYSAAYRVKINIADGGEILRNRIILFTAYYENNIDDPFISIQLYTDNNGECEYIIDQIGDGYDNMTVYFEYLGSNTVAYNFTNRSDEISPKWRSSFSYIPLPSIIRYGQKITFNMTFWCPENNSISFDGLSVSFMFEYTSTSEFYTRYISENNTLLFEYIIADAFESNLNITISLLGNSKIGGNTSELSIEVQDKILVNLIFVQNPSNQYFQGTQFISVLVIDSLNNPLTETDIIFELYMGDNLIDTTVATTNEEGIASASLEFSEIGDNLIIKVIFMESGYYQSSEINSPEIRVVNEFIIFLDYLPYILTSVGVIFGLSLLVYRGVIIPKRRRKQESLKKIYQRLSDVENIQYILILTKDGGVPVFSKSLADVPIDESLISGFLSAISSFGEEIGTKMRKQEGGLEQLSYRQFKIILNEGKYVRTALLLLKRPSDMLKSKLEKFNQIFEEKFVGRLINYDGKIFKETSIMPLIEEIFEADLLYPHQIVETRVRDYIKTTSRKELSRKILITAKSDEFESSFYLRDMINHLKTRGIEEIESFEALERLKSDDIVFAINPRTNYLIEQLQPVIKALKNDDRVVLFAIFEGVIGKEALEKYLNKKKVSLSEDVQNILKKLYQYNLILSDGDLTETGAAIATLLKLIPDL